MVFVQHLGLYCVTDVIKKNILRLIISEERAL
jgi:hypothetical protein